MSTKAGESLKNYNGVITAGNNGTKPTGNPYDCSNWRNDTTWPSVYGSSPKVNWNSPTVYDRITYGNLGCGALTTTANYNNSGSGIDFWTGLTMACTGVPAVMSVVQSVAGLFNKGDKSSDSADSACDSNLAESVDRANNIDKKTSLTDLTSLSQTMTTRIGTANKKLDTAKRVNETATKTISNLDQNKSKKDDELATFDANKASLEADIVDLKSKLSALDPNAQNYNDLKQQINAQIAEKKKAIEDNYSDTKRKTITNEIDRLDKEINEWKLKQAEAKETIDKLPKEIKEAEKAKKKVDDEITKRNSKQQQS